METSLRGLFGELSAGVESEGSASVVGEARGGAGDAAGGGMGQAGNDGTSATAGASVEALRAALAEISLARFGVGKMDDAVEAMETILGERRQDCVRRTFLYVFVIFLFCP